MKVPALRAAALRGAVASLELKSASSAPTAGELLDLLLLDLRSSLERNESLERRLSMAGDELERADAYVDSEMRVAELREASHESELEDLRSMLLEERRLRMSAEERATELACNLQSALLEADNLREEASLCHDRADCKSALCEQLQLRVAQLEKALAERSQLQEHLLHFRQD